FNAFARVALSTCAVHKERLTSAVRAGYLAPYDSWTNRVATLRFVQDIPMEPRDRAYAVLQDIEAGLHKFRDRPMLICWGAKDFVFDDEFFGEWQRRFPRAEPHRFEDAGHYVVEDAHERIIPLIERLFAADAPRAEAIA